MELNTKIVIFITVFGVVWGVLVRLTRLLEFFFRGKADDKINQNVVNINQKVGEANETGKNATDAVNEYKRLKREYDDERNK